MTSSGPQNIYTVILRVPERATVGEVYWVQAQRSDDVQSLLWLYDNYEVCDFAATRSIVAHGDSVRLRGHIDGKTATLFMRYGRAGQPASTKAQGWTKVADLSASAGVRFVSPGLRPSRTTWYVARYHGKNGGFTAFTPVVKASVRRVRFGQRTSAESSPLSLRGVWSAAGVQGTRSAPGIMRTRALSPKQRGTAISETSAHLSSGYHVRPRSSQARVRITGAWMR